MNRHTAFLDEGSVTTFRHCPFFSRHDPCRERERETIHSYGISSDSVCLLCAASWIFVFVFLRASQRHFPHAHQHALQAICLHFLFGLLHGVHALRDIVLHLSAAVRPGHYRFPNLAVVLLPGATTTTTRLTSVSVGKRKPILDAALLYSEYIAPHLFHNSILTST